MRNGDQSMRSNAKVNETISAFLPPITIFARLQFFDGTFDLTYSADRSMTANTLKERLLAVWAIENPSWIPDVRDMNSYSHLLVDETPVFDNLATLSEIFKRERSAKVSLIINCTLTQTVPEEEEDIESVGALVANSREKD